MRIGAQIVVIISIFVFFGYTPDILIAQENGSDTDVILLLKGPKQQRGIEVLPPNVIPYFYGEYQFFDHTVIVHFTGSTIVSPDSWDRMRCGSYPLQYFPSPIRPNEETVYFYQRQDEWYIFIRIPAAVEEPCVFINPFLKKLIYFIGIARDEKTVPLPAVIELE